LVKLNNFKLILQRRATWHGEASSIESRALFFTKSGRPALSTPEPHARSRDAPRRIAMNKSPLVPPLPRSRGLSLAVS
jgi:hypothetical protein